MLKKITTIITHKSPHFDEIVAIWLLRKFGEPRFPGISTARIVFQDSEDIFRQGTPQELEQKGILLVGIGGGKFDEHPTLGIKRKHNECATTLVAKALKIDKRPQLKQILKFTTTTDVKGGSQPFDLASLVKLIHQQFPDRPEKAIEWATTALEAKYAEQLRFVTTTRREFKSRAEIDEVYVRNKKLKIVTITSDDENMSKFARSRYGCQAAVVIQKFSTGNVLIHSNKQMGISLYDVAKIIRFCEQQAKGNIVTTDWNELASEGRVAGAEEWFFHEAGQMLLNGSLTARDAPPTHLSLRQIKEAVKIGINSELLKPFCKSSGRRILELCDWSNWGLERCQKLRNE